MTDVLDKDSAQHWQKRAQETRADAEREADAEIKSVMLEIAAHYEQLAELTAKRGTP